LDVRKERNKIRQLREREEMERVNSIIRDFQEGLLSLAEFKEAIDSD
jgi:hypothetical protein